MYLTPGKRQGEAKMRVSEGVRMVLAGLALMSAPSHGQTGQSDLEHAKELARAGQFDQSLALLDPIIAQAMLKDAKDPAAICPSMAQRASLKPF